MSAEDAAATERLLLHCPSSPPADPQTQYGDAQLPLLLRHAAGRGLHRVTAAPGSVLSLGWRPDDAPAVPAPPAALAAP